MAEMLWGFLLFPSNMKARTKRRKIREIWDYPGSRFSRIIRCWTMECSLGLGLEGQDSTITGLNELEYLIALVRDLKQKNKAERRHILTDYEHSADG